MPRQKSTYLFDTNALIYWTNKTSPRNQEVSALIRELIMSDAQIYALTSSLTDTYYTLKTKYTDEPTARSSIRLIAKVFDLVDLGGAFVYESLDSNEPDYEDGLIRAAAEALQVDAIVSYDERAFRKSFIPKVTALDVLATLREQSEDENS